MRSKAAKLFVLFILGTVLLSMKSSSYDNVIKGDLAFLIGTYDFTFNDDGQKNIKKADQYPDKYSVKITKSSLVLYKNDRKEAKYPFSDIKLDILDDGTYVMFMREGEYYPMFYKDNKISIHVFPEMYIDNYYFKVK